MNFFEHELSKVLRNAVYIGRAAYIKLGGNVIAKVRFVSTGIKTHYDSVRVSIKHITNGEIDTNVINLKDIWNCRKAKEPVFIWEDDEIDWYGYRPTDQDYQTLMDLIDKYLKVFTMPPAVVPGVYPPPAPKDNTCPIIGVPDGTCFNDCARCANGGTHHLVNGDCVPRRAERME